MDRKLKIFGNKNWQKAHIYGERRYGWRLGVWRWLVQTDCFMKAATTRLREVIET